eukprot:4239164-Pleurochrysis_carterae.AAC.2
MHSFPICIRTARVLAERSRSAPQALEPSLAHGRCHPQSGLDRSHPLGVLSPRACARSPTVAARVHIQVATPFPPHYVALFRSQVITIYKVHANSRRVWL